MCTDSRCSTYNHKNLKEAFTYFTIILLLASCNSDRQSASDEMPPLYPAPQTVALNTEEGYIINPVTGDSIQSIVNSLGDTIKTGVPVPAKGKAIHPDSVAQPKIIPAGEPKVVPTHLNVYKIPENLTVIPVNKDSLKTFTPGVDTSSFMLVNSNGDTVPTGVPIPAKGKVVPCIQPQPVKALPPRMKDNARVNMKYLDIEQGMNSLYVSSILEDSHGNLWFGTDGAGVSMYNGETFTHFTKKEGLSNNRIYSILEDSHGNLWFGTYGGGVSMYNGESFTHFTEKEGLSYDYVQSILEDSQGNLWFGTYGGGVSMYNGESFTHFTEKEGLSNNIVYSILEDSSSNIWLSTRRGLNLVMFDPDSVSNTMNSLSASSVKEDSVKVAFYNPVIHTYSKQDGLKGMDFKLNSVLLDSKNRIWWGSQINLTMLDMNNFKIPIEPPSMQLNRIEINEQFVDYRQLKDSAGIEMEFNDVARFYNYPLNLELPYNLNHLTFHFSAIDWSAPHKIKYSYKMEGLNDNWSLPTAEAKADYRTLPYGTYTFKVHAIGEAQKWSEPFEYTFTILPPWWHTWWARTGYGITTLLLFFGFVRWRTANLKQRQKELEQTVKDRTVEILEKNEELNQQNFQIREQKQDITDRIQYASRIQTAILPPDEVLKYLLPKHFILYKPRDIVSGDFYWLTQKREKIIIVVADCTGHGVPGAFMSMLGNALINDIVNNIKTLQANFILNELRDQVMVSLRQTGKTDEAKDGMDIALCILDKENMALQYAGAFNPLYLIRNGKLTEIKADKMPIGISSKAGKSFTNNELTLQKDDALYLSSDGYVDQFGGPKGKKFMSTRFKQLLIDIQDKIMFEQKEILEQTLNEWMGITGLHEEQYEQIDDIIVMGIKI